MADEVQDVTGEAAPAAPAPRGRKPGKKAPQVQPGQKVSLDGVKSLQALEQLGLPKTANGGSLLTWQQDLEAVSKVEVSGDGNTWATVWVNPKIKDAGAVAKVPQVQLRSLLFIVQSYLVRPVTDRGYAYTKWVADNSTTLKGVFGNVSIRIHSASAAVSLLPISVAPALKRAELTLADLEAGLALQAPQRRAVTGKKKATAEAEADLVFGINI